MMLRMHLWQVEAREGTGTVVMEQKGLGESACTCVHVCAHSPPAVTLWGQSSRALAHPEWERWVKKGQAPTANT